MARLDPPDAEHPSCGQRHRTRRSFEVVDTESSFVPRLGIVCAPLNTAIPIPTVRLSWVPQLRGSHEAMALGTPPLRACSVRHHPDLASGGSSRLHLSRRLGPDRCPLPGVRTASARRNLITATAFYLCKSPEVRSESSFNLPQNLDHRLSILCAFLC